MLILFYLFHSLFNQSDEVSHVETVDSNKEWKLWQMEEGVRCLDNAADHTRRQMDEHKENDVKNGRTKEEDEDDEEGKGTKITQEMCEERDGQRKKEEAHDVNAVEKRRTKQEQQQHDDDEEDDKENYDDGREIRALRKMFMLSVAYAANVGGTGSPIGCGPNIVLMGLLQKYVLGRRLKERMVA